MADEFIIKAHQAPVITFLARDGKSYVQEVPFGRLTMPQLINLADDACYIGVLDLTNTVQITDITEQVAEAFLEQYGDDGKLPEYVYFSKALDAFRNRVPFTPSREWGTMNARAL